MTSAILLQPAVPAAALAAHGCPAHMTYTEAGVVGLIQGISELFPVSSLGHNVLIPALAGGCWAQNLNVAAAESPYLAFIVGLHVATAIALIGYFWRDWVRIIRGFFASLGHLLRPAPGTNRWQMRDADEKLAWLIVIASIPVGIVGLAGEHTFRVVFGHAVWAAVFLVVNGLILLAAERRYRSHPPVGDPASGEPAAALVPELVSAGADHPATRQEHGRLKARWQKPPFYRASSQPISPGGTTPRTPRGQKRRVAPGHQAARLRESAQAVVTDQRLAEESYWRGTVIGAAQILALLAGISRDGVVMAVGMFRGLTREDAARFSFLLSAPVILAAGLLKIPDLMGPLGDGIRGQTLFASVLAGVGGYLAVRFLVRYLRTRTLTPFGIYCLALGLGSVVYLELIR